MTCDECKAIRAKNSAEHSSEWSVSKALAKENKRLFIIIIAVIILWLLTVGFALWQTVRFEEYKKADSGHSVCDVCFSDIQSNKAVMYSDIGLELPKRKVVCKKKRTVRAFNDNEVLL